MPRRSVRRFPINISRPLPPPQETVLFSFFSHEYERDTLLAPCLYWMDMLDDDQVVELACAAMDVFDDWKWRQIGDDGMVPQFEGGGGGLLNLPVIERRVRPEDADAWKCAGGLVRNDVDLAFKLWLDLDPAFTQLIHFPRGLEPTLSIVGLWSRNSASVTSLFRLNGLMVDSLRADARFLRRATGELLRRSNEESRQKRDRNKKTVERLNASRKAVRAEAKRTAHGQVRSMAQDYRRAHLDATKSDVIDYLRTKTSYTESTLSVILAGLFGPTKSQAGAG